MKRKKILIVEDETHLLKLETVLLAAKGYQVMGVGDGLEALGAIKEFRPDLVLLDIMLPGIDGFEVCRRIRGDSETRAIPVVMLTAKGSSADFCRGKEAGADRYLTKPFKTSAVVEAVQNCLAVGA
ncbi:MAG: response regulator [Deltaproteobacteria bacterium]|nr:response regulator [Deltaproteobacteria bacterium]